MTPLDEGASGRACGGGLTRARMPAAHAIVTHLCNLACEHCYQAEHQKASGELSTAEWVAVFDELVAMRCLSLTIGGGEPMARPDFWELLDAARARRFSVELFTNGTLVTPEAAKRLAGYSLTSVALSLHQADAASADRFMHRPGAFEKINRAVDLLEAEGIRTVVKSNVLANNAQDLVQLRGRFAGRKLVTVGVNVRVHARDDGDPSSQVLAPGERELAQAMGRNTAQLDKAALERVFDGARRKLAAAGQRAPCSAGRDYVVIQPNGDVLPCQQTSGQLMGNVRARPLREIWAESAVGMRFRTLTQGDFYANPAAPCPSCELRDVCSRCAALSLSETGTLTGYSEQVCRSTKVMWDGLRARAAELGVECPV